MFYKERYLKKGGRFHGIWMAAVDLQKYLVEPDDDLLDVCADLAQLLHPTPEALATQQVPSLRLSSTLLAGAARRHATLTDELLRDCEALLDDIKLCNKPQIRRSSRIHERLSRLRQTRSEEVSTEGSISLSHDEFKKNSSNRSSPRSKKTSPKIETRGNLTNSQSSENINNSAQDVSNMDSNSFSPVLLSCTYNKYDNDDTISNLSSNNNTKLSTITNPSNLTNSNEFTLESKQTSSEASYSSENTSLEIIERLTSPEPEEYYASIDSLQLSYTPSQIRFRTNNLSSCFPGSTTDESPKIYRRTKYSEDMIGLMVSDRNSNDVQGMLSDLQPRSNKNPKPCKITLRRGTYTISDSIDEISAKKKRDSKNEPDLFDQILSVSPTKESINTPSNDAENLRNLVRNSDTSTIQELTTIAQKLQRITIQALQTSVRKRDGVDFCNKDDTTNIEKPNENKSNQENNNKSLENNEETHENSYTTIESYRDVSRSTRSTSGGEHEATSSERNLQASLRPGSRGWSTAPATRRRRQRVYRAGKDVTLVEKAARDRRLNLRKKKKPSQGQDSRDSHKTEMSCNHSIRDQEMRKSPISSGNISLLSPVISEKAAQTNVTQTNPNQTFNSGDWESFERMQMISCISPPSFTNISKCSISPYSAMDEICKVKSPDHATKRKLNSNKTIEKLNEKERLKLRSENKDTDSDVSYKKRRYSDKQFITLPYSQSLSCEEIEKCDSTIAEILRRLSIMSSIPSELSQSSLSSPQESQEMQVTAEIHHNERKTTSASSSSELQNISEVRAQKNSSSSSPFSETEECIDEEYIYLSESASNYSMERLETIPEISEPESETNKENNIFSKDAISNLSMHNSVPKYLNNKNRRSPGKEYTKNYTKEKTNKSETTEEIEMEEEETIEEQEKFSMPVQYEHGILITNKESDEDVSYQDEAEDVGEEMIVDNDKVTDEQSIPDHDDYSTNSDIVFIQNVNTPEHQSSPHNIHIEITNSEEIGRSNDILTSSEQHSFLSSTSSTTSKSSMHLDCVTSICLRNDSRNPRLLVKCRLSDLPNLQNHIYNNWRHVFE